MIRDTGSPRIDAEHDFLRARRRQVLSALAARMRGLDTDDRRALPFQDVVDALGLVSEVSIGRRMIPVDRVIGSVDKVRDFDPQFRPSRGQSRFRWERIAEAARRGEPLPPIDVYQIGDSYFVRDGHHRVSVYRELQLPTIEADVRQVHTLVEPEDLRSHSELDARELRRVFMERVPVGKTARRALAVSDAAQYPVLAETVEAWAARLIFAEGRPLSRQEAAVRWYEEEFVPVSGMIAEAGLLLRGETPVDAYLRVSCERYALFRDHAWNADMIETLGQRQK